jgi:hypothetical protein
MTTLTLDEASTVRDLLFGDARDEATNAIAGSLRDHGTVRLLVPPVLAPAAEREVASATDGLLSLNLADVAAAGWKRYDALVKAARSTRDSPTAKEVVTVMTHKIQSSHHPTVDMELDGRTIATINIGLELTFSIAGGTALVQRGRLMEIHTGTCTVIGSLTVQQVPIVQRQRKFDLPGMVQLRNGIPLLGPREPITSSVPAAGHHESRKQLTDR